MQILRAAKCMYKVNADCFTTKYNHMTTWKTIYERWYDPMHKLALRYLQNNLFAEDIVQDIFLRLLEKKLSPQFMEYAEAYLRTAVYHRCISLLRKKKQLPCIDEWASNTTEETIFFRELTLLHSQAIQSLPLREKEVYILSHIGGYKKETLATLFGSSAKTVKKQLQVSRKKVREQLVLLVA